MLTVWMNFTLENRWENWRAEGRGRRSEVRGQMTDDSEKSLEVGGRIQKTEDGGQTTEDRGQKEIRRQRSEVRGQKTEDRGQKTAGSWQLAEVNDD